MRRSFLLALFLGFVAPLFGNVAQADGTASPGTSPSQASVVAETATPDKALVDEVAALRAKGDSIRYTVKTVNPESSIDTGGAAILINAPIATVRKFVTDYRHYENFIKGFEQSRVLSKKKGVSEVYLQVPVMNGSARIWAVVNAGPIEADGDGEKLVARYSKGNVDDFRATWRIRAVDAEHTLLKMEIFVAPKLPVPVSMVVSGLRVSADRAVTAVREQAEAMTKAQAAVAHQTPSR